MSECNKSMTSQEIKEFLGSIEIKHQGIKQYERDWFPLYHDNNSDLEFRIRPTPVYLVVYRFHGDYKVSPRYYPSREAFESEYGNYSIEFISLIQESKREE